MAEGILKTTNTEETKTSGELKVPRRILASLLSSVSAGVVPRSGAAYIAIGRNDEIEALASDLGLAEMGGGSMRFLIGKYGSGKSFLIQLMRGYAMDKGFVTADCDLSPERRICGSGGGGIATYRELLKNLSTKTSPDGGALPSLIAKWLSGLRSTLAAEGYTPDTPAFKQALDGRVHQLIHEMEGQIGGFDFARVILKYHEAYAEENDEVMSYCIRWLRGEFTTKTEAKSALRVGSIIDDSNWFDYIKLLAVFVRAVGYKGLALFIDECVNLYKIPNRISRENNYEKLLSMFNDSLQGRSPGLSIVMGGTPQFLEDTRRGLFSYEALRSRLADGKYVSGSYKNLFSPVIRLRRMSGGELLALLKRITLLYGQYHGAAPRVSDSQMEQFLRLCLERTGAVEMLTPRELLREYMTVLDVLLQNPEATFEEILPGIDLSKAPAGDEDCDDPLALPDFEL